MNRPTALLHWTSMCRWILACAVVPLLVSCSDTSPTGTGPASPLTPTVVMQTSMGDITIELYPDQAPGTVRNFLRYVNDGFYTGLIFHRVIQDFIIQGGGYTPALTEPATRGPIVDEADNGLSNARGTIAMARHPDPDSATSQFFINIADNVFLNHRDDTAPGYGYAVFGRVVAGMDVIDRIAATPTETRDGLQNVPVTSIVIRRVGFAGSWNVPQSSAKMR